MVTETLVGQILYVNTFPDCGNEIMDRAIFIGPVYLSASMEDTKGSIIITHFLSYFIAAHCSAFVRKNNSI